MRILPVGDSAVSVELGDSIDPALNARIRALDRQIEQDPWPGLVEVIPTYRSLLVVFDPLTCPHEEVAARTRRLAAELAEGEDQPPPVKEVPTVYDGEDLAEVAASVGLSREEVIRLHAESEVRVYMLGFSPGFAYMGLLPEALTTPRRVTPRTRVPEGAVAVAGRQTSVYPSPNPSGWHLIGRSNLRLFDPAADPPTFFQPGDRVRFVPTRELPTRTIYSEDWGGAKGVPTLEVIKRRVPQTTVQDLGRIGYQRYGVPVAGAVDAPALRAANLLVGNVPGAAALECTVAGPILLRSLRRVLIATTGADLGAVVESRDSGRRILPPWSSYLMEEGDVLRFTERHSGARAYLAVAGGIDVPDVLGSRATYLPAGLGGYGGRALLPGDVIYATPPKAAGAKIHWPEELIPRYAPEVTVRVILGPQDDFFTEKGRETLLSSEYSVSVSSDRWGVRLEGPRLEHGKANEIVSDGMMLGAIQVPPDGRPIVMLADRATSQKSGSSCLATEYDFTRSVWRERSKRFAESG
jgi:KipI family sensor histidine kinase inhibitor